MVDSETPVRNVRRRLHSKTCKIGSVICVALSSLIIFIIFWCTNIFRDKMLSNLELRNGTIMFNWWIHPPTSSIYKIRIFNYTNVDDFQNGNAKKLKIVEAGPYEYRETLTRVNPIMNEDGTITYQEERSFQWEGGSPDDENVIVPNVPLLSAMAFTRDMSFVAQLGLTMFLMTLQSEIFINVPAGKFIWGYDDKIFEMAKPFMSSDVNIPFDKFGILAIKNGLSADRITINTGMEDINEVGVFRKLNGQESRNIWGDERCDKIEGTDGSIFPPKLMKDQNSILKVYVRDQCRTWPLKYQGQGTVYGIPTLTYKPPLDALTSTATKDNCYCEKVSSDLKNTSRVCPAAGIFDSSPCTFNMPIFTSFPHFYGGDQKLRDTIDGLNPRAEDHESLFEIHPLLGIPMSGYSRAQVNVGARKVAGVPFLGNIKDGTILPLLWMENVIGDIPDDLETIFYNAYFTVGAIETSMKWISVAGIIFSICSAILIVKSSRCQRHEAIQKNVSVLNPLMG